MQHWAQISALAVILTLGSAFAGVDQVQIDLLAQYPLPLRWDNVEAEPQWVAGVRPIHTGVEHWQASFREDADQTQVAEAPETGMSLVTLAPGDSVTVWIPASEALRVYRPAGRLALGDLEFARSDGSGLYVETPTYPSVRGQSLILPPTWPDERLVRVSRSAQASGALEVGLFISRREALATIAPYRQLIEPDESASATGSLRSSEVATAQPFWPLQAQPALRVSVSGPVRLALENRLRYPLPEVETRQAYRIYAYLDGRPWQALDFVVGAEMRQAIWVNGCAETLGRLEIGYLDIPKGKHELTLAATQPLYARLLAQADPDYLVPELNAPPWTAAEARVRYPVRHGSLWDLTQVELARPLDSMTLAEQERTVLRLARDNHYGNGGLVAAMTLRQAALAHREEPALTGQARDVAGMFTFYRHLLPANKPTTMPQRFAWLRDHALLAPDAQLRERTVAERFSETLLDVLPSGYFTELPAEGELDYHLPERDEPSLLRIAVDPASLNETVTFWLRYDDQPPLPLRVAMPELAESLFLPGTGETAVMLLSERHGQPAANTLNAPFAALRTPGPLMQTARVEIPLPTGIRRIRLGGAIRPLAVAMHYRTSRPYALSESEYLDVARRLGPDAVQKQFQAWLRDAFANQKYPDPPTATGVSFDSTRDARRELDNYWQPLRRWLNGQTHQLMTALAATAPETVPGNSTVAIAKARRLEDIGELLPAMAQWSELTRSSNVQIRAEALAGQTRALDQLGEEFMAELLLRGTFLYETDAAIREQVFSELTQRYRAVGDEGALMNLTTLAAARYPQPAHWRQWISLLLEQNEPEFALMVALALPPAEWPAADLARAAHTLGWLRVFDLAVERLPDAVQRALWRGHRAHQQGNDPVALKLWREAGSAGQALIETLEQGLAIRARLADDNAATRERAVTDWNQWRIHHPGPHIWQAADHLIEDHAGAVLLYAQERHLYAQTYRAHVDRPLQMAVYGPVRLRINARLIHPSGTTQETPPVNDWLIVRDGPHVERLPITADRPAQGLTMVGTDAAPGREMTLDYTVGAGLHRIQITGDQQPLLTRVQSWQPELPLRVLPELTPLTAAAAAMGAHRQPGMTPSQSVRVIADCQLASRPLPVRPPWPVDQEAIEATLMRLTALEPPGRVWPESPVPPDQLLRNRLIALLWDVEHAPDQLAQRLPEAEQWVAAQPGVPGVEALMRRLRIRAEWEVVTTLTQSAGLHDLEVQGWQPETPMLRVRKALAPPTARDEQVLSGDEQLGLLIANAAPSRLRIELRAMDVRYLPQEPLTVWRQMDDQPEQQFTLPPSAPARSLIVDTPPGQHVLRLGIVNPLANQFLRVRVSELRNGVAQPVTGDLKRRFQVATAAEPLRLRVAGPAWLRIDEAQGDTLDSRYRYFGPGLHELELKPDREQTARLFRIHRQVVLDTPREPTPPRVTTLTVTPPPSAPVTVSVLPEPVAMATIDRYALGSQPSGTWSLGVTLARATPPADESGDSSTADEYLEALGSWRLFAPWDNDYYQVDALYRLHQRGSPTIGLRGFWRHDTDWPGISFRLGWEGYAQESVDWAWNSTVRGQITQTRDLGPKTRHQPSLGFFYRNLHQQSGYDYMPGFVDPDVLSEYKYFHRRGLVLADTLVHRPWLDTLWYAGAALTSDENGNLFDPEHARINVGWKQLLGSWIAEMAYHRTWYFAQGDHDWNRPEATQRKILEGHLLWENHWGGQGRLNAGLQVQYHLDNREPGFWFTLEWFADHGRGYRDFRPGQVDFRDLRERQLPLYFNNRIEDPSASDLSP